MKIAVLYGGISSERNVSISSGSAIIKALRKLGYHVFPVDLGLGLNSTPTEIASIPEMPPAPDELLQLPASKDTQLIFDTITQLKNLGIDLVFNSLHGGIGENGEIQSLLEIAKIPYTGSRVVASAVAMDKTLTKQLASLQGVPTPKFLFANRTEDGENILAKLNLKFPLVVKPNDDGSSVGLSIVNSKSDFLTAWEKAAALGDVLIEEFIEGRELTVAILGEDALPVVEIRPEGGVYDYEHKYQKGKTQYFCPADLEPRISDEAKRLALLTFQAVKCKGYARVDFRMDVSGNLFMLEVNTLPGMTGTSLVPKAAKAAGMEFEDLVQKIVSLT